jgi:hypothetical protein
LNDKIIEKIFKKKLARDKKKIATKRMKIKFDRKKT